MMMMMTAVVVVGSARKRRVHDNVVVVAHQRIALSRRVLESQFEPQHCRCACTRIPCMSFDGSNLREGSFF
jgi:hypothetical protein